MQPDADDGMDVDRDEEEDGDDDEEEDGEEGERPKVTKQMLLVMAMQGHHEVLEASLQSDDALGPNIADQIGMSLLHWACCNGHPETVRMLLTLNANPGQRDSWGQSPLDLAVRKNHQAVVEVLNAYTAAMSSSSSAAGAPA